MPTKDQVLAAIVGLEAAGAHVSPKTIRQQLGDYGSFRDIVQHYKQIVSEGPRPRRRPPTPSQRETPDRRPGLANGTHASSSAPPLPPAPAPEPLDQRARLEHYLGLARQRKADLEAEKDRLSTRTWKIYRNDEVEDHNRKIAGTNHAIEQAQRDIVQYLSEISRLHQGQGGQ